MGSVLQIIRRLLVLGVGESCRAEPENSTKTESRGEGKGKRENGPTYEKCIAIFYLKIRVFLVLSTLGVPAYNLLYDHM